MSNVEDKSEGMFSSEAVVLRGDGEPLSSYDYIKRLNDIADH